jgi:hypothetical protein
VRPFARAVGLFSVAELIADCTQPARNSESNTASEPDASVSEDISCTEIREERSAGSCKKQQVHGGQKMPAALSWHRDESFWQQRLQLRSPSHDNWHGVDSEDNCDEHVSETARCDQLARSK